MAELMTRFELVAFIAEMWDGDFIDETDMNGAMTHKLFSIINSIEDYEERDFTKGTFDIDYSEWEVSHDVGQTKG